MAGSEELEGSVFTDNFFKAVSKINGDEIELSMSDDKKSFIVKAGKSRSQLITTGEYNESDFITSVNNVVDWEMAPSTLCKAFDLCKIDKNNSNFKGVFVSGKKVYSTDKSQIISYELDCEVPAFLIPQESANTLCKVMPTVKYINVSDNFVHFQNDNITVSARLLDKGKYIPEDKLEMILNDEKNVCLYGKLPEKLIDAVDRASLFGRRSSTDKMIVTVAFDDKVIHVHSKNANGEFAEDVEYDITPETPIVAYISYEILSFLLKRDSEFKLFFDAGQGIANKIAFVSDKCKYVSMLFNSEGR